MMNVVSCWSLRTAEKKMFEQNPLRSPGEGNGYPLHYSCLENPIDGGVWWTIFHGVTESDMTEQLTLPFTVG